MLPGDLSLYVTSPSMPGQLTVRHQPIPEHKLTKAHPGHPDATCRHIQCCMVQLLWPLPSTRSLLSACSACMTAAPARTGKAIKPLNVQVTRHALRVLASAAGAYLAIRSTDDGHQTTKATRATWARACHARQQSGLPAVPSNPHTTVCGW